MGIILEDRNDESNLFFINFWHWRTIVEAVRRLDVLDKETVDGLHEEWADTGLTREQARTVAQALEERLLPRLDEEDWLLLDGSVSDEPFDPTFQKVDIEKNYSTNAKVMRKFKDYCRSSNGFTVG